MTTVQCPLVLPACNLHGTPVDEMRDTVLSVRTKVREMIKAVESAAPNGRDYYPLGPDAINVALAGHRACVVALGRLVDELLVIGDPDSRDDKGARAMSLVAELTAAIPEVPAVTPIVHLNGTSAEELKTTGAAVFRASHALEDCFGSIAPNGRDYASTDDWIGARAQHGERVALVRRIGCYYLQIAMACRDRCG